MPPRGNAESGGDSYGNRVDRFLAGTAYLDGTRPGLIVHIGGGMPAAQWPVVRYAGCTYGAMN